MSYNPEEAKNEITDLITQVEGHDAWIQEQFNSTQTRITALQQAIKQADRLKQMLEHQVGDVPTQQQYALIITLKNDFLKAVARIQDDLVSSSTGQSLHDSRTKIEELTLENEEIKHQLQQDNMQLTQNEQQIHTLRQENERLQRLKDLLIQQQDAMNQRLSQHKGKDQKIEELKQSMHIINQEKETLNNNFKLQIDSLNSSCKQLIEANEASKSKRKELETEKSKLQNQFTILLQQKTDLKQEHQELLDKYHGLNEKHTQLTHLKQEHGELLDKYHGLTHLKQEHDELLRKYHGLSEKHNELTHLKQEHDQLLRKYNGLSEKHNTLTQLNTDATERNLSSAAQIDALNDNIDMLQSKIEQLSQQTHNKNKQISEEQSKAQDMLNQRESLQNKLRDSQQTILDLQRKCQDFEIQLTEKTQSPAVVSSNYIPSDNISSGNNISSDVLLSFSNINHRLAPVDELITQFVSDWKYNSQVFILNDQDEIKENEEMENRFKEWISFESVFDKVNSEISSARDNTDHSQVATLVVDLLTQKLSLLKHLGTVHMTKGQQMSQIMYEAQQRIVSLQSDLMKKNREMEIHLKVKEKMYEEIKSVQQKVENLTREYQTIVSELDHVRKGRKDSVDSSFS